MKMKKIMLLVLMATAYTANAAPGITIHYQKHYACSWVFNGTQAAPDMYIGINPTSGALSAQRQGYEAFYAKPTGNENEWLEINPQPADNSPQLITIDDNGNLKMYQGGNLMSECMEVE